MHYKLKVITLVTSGIVASALAILAFAGMISRPPVVPYRAEAELPGNITGSVNVPLETTVVLNNPDKDIHAAICLDSSNRKSIIGSLQLPGNLESIYIDENKALAYIANSYSGLQIVDISDPEDLHMHGSLPDVGHAWDIKVLDDILFLASAQEGLFLIDISSSEKPKVISRIKFKNNSVLKLAVSNQTVYASTGKKGLLIIDTSDINAPKLVNTLYADTGAWGLLTHQNKLFVSCGSYRLEVLDLSIPTQPRKMGRVTLPDASWDMAMHDSVLYLPTKNEGLVLVDTSKPDSPERLESTVVLIRPDSIDLQQDRAYISSRTGSMSILDLTIPKAPELIGTFDLPNRPRSIAISGQTTYLASGLDGLQALKTDELISADQITRLQVQGRLVQALFDDDFFYLATANSGLSVAQRDATGNPGAVVVTLPLPSGVQRMVRQGNYLFLACSRSGLQIIDISNPLIPTIISDTDFAENVTDIVAIGNRLFLADYKLGLQVVDITSADKPILIETFPLSQLMKLTADDKYIYAATTETGLHILEYSTSAAMQQVGTLNLPWPLQKFANIKRIAVSGETIYMAAGAAELITFDISDPTSPQLREIINLDGDPQSVTFNRNMVYVSTRQGKLFVLHKEENERLHRRAVIDSLGKGLDLIVDGDRMIVVNGVKGLALLPLPKQVKISRQTNSAVRSGTSPRMTVSIPSQSAHGVYNLTLFNRGEQIDFVGAVTLSETSD